MIEAFETNTLLNPLGSLQSIIFAPVDIVSKVPYILNCEWQEPIGQLLYPNKEFYNARYDRDTASLKITDVSNNKGNLYKVELSASITAYNNSLDAVMQQLRTQKYVVITFDHNKTNRVIGTKKKGCEFSYTFDTDRNLEGYIRYSYKFTWEASYFPPMSNIAPPC